MRPRGVASLALLSLVFGCQDRRDPIAPRPSLDVGLPVATTTLDFDDLPEGFYPVDQFSSRGIIIKAVSLGQTGGFSIEDVSAHAGLFPGITPPNVLSGGGFAPGPGAGLRCNWTLRAEFVDLNTGISATVSSVRILTIGQAASIDIPNDDGSSRREPVLTTFRLRAFDAQGNLVASDEFQTQRLGLFEPFDARVLQVTAPDGISFVELDADPSDGCHVHDNFELQFFLPIRVDVKPGSDENPINPSSNGKTPVALVSTTTFNAPSQTVQSSLTLGRTGLERSLAFCNPEPEDVSADGLPDLVCHFNTQLMDLQNGTVFVVLEGRHANGSLIKGSDRVRITKPAQLTSTPR